MAVFFVTPYIYKIKFSCVILLLYRMFLLTLENKNYKIL